MTFKNIVRELRGMRDGIGAGMSRRGNERNNDTSSSSNKNSRRRGRSHIAPEGSSASSSQTYEPVDQSIWVGLSPELLLDIIRRIESSQTSWPARRDVVACASVCRSWREITKEVVKTPELCSLLTFPVSLKQPGPRDAPIQCFIRRERATGTYRLYLGLSPALSGDLSKLLLAAKKVRRATSVEFVISLSGNDFSRTSSNYVGKLRSNFLGTKFTVYDGQPPLDPEILSNCKLNRKLKSRQVSPWVSTSNYNIASISYELNVLRTRGPRRMQCVMHSIPFSSVEEGGTAPTPTEFTKSVDSNCHPCLDYKEKKKGKIGFCSGNIRESLLEPNSDRSRHPLVLKNKAPRWHEQLQCWCLNFKGRVTVASVKNFQLVAAAEPGQNIPVSEQERVILQFGKIGKDIFTMDYRYPLSVFQAFAICLSSFDTKPACE